MMKKKTKKTQPARKKKNATVKVTVKAGRASNKQNKSNKSNQKNKKKKATAFIFREK